MNKEEVLDLKSNDVVLIIEPGGRRLYLIVDRASEHGIQFKRRSGIIVAKDWQELFVDFAFLGAEKLSPKEGKLAKTLLFQ